MNITNYLYSHPLVLLIVTLWILFWKGWALWTAAKNNKKVWFVVLLVVNTIGLLEIIYIFVVAKRKWSDLKRIVPTTDTPEKNNSEV
jgi:methionyl-tRNA synthetase